MPDFFFHIWMACPASHCHSCTSEVRAGNSWAQDNSLPDSSKAQDYDAHRYCHGTPMFVEELTAEHFAQKMSNLVSHWREVTNPDSQ